MNGLVKRPTPVRLQLLGPTPGKTAIFFGSSESLFGVARPQFLEDFFLIRTALFPRAPGQTATLAVARLGGGSKKYSTLK